MVPLVFETARGAKLRCHLAGGPLDRGCLVLVEWVEDVSGIICGASTGGGDGLVVRAWCPVVRHVGQGGLCHRRGLRNRCGWTEAVVVVDAVGVVALVEVGGGRLRCRWDVTSLSQGLSCLLEGPGYIGFCW